MAIDCDAILRLAAEDISIADCEARFRNVIGRAYYASYHKATAFHSALPDQGIEPSEKVGVHRALSYALQNPTVSNTELRKKSRQIGYICRDLHGRRVDADYNIEKDIKKKDAEQSLEQARHIFELTTM